jgi:hypothetical protein
MDPFHYCCGEGKRTVQQEGFLMYDLAILSGLSLPLRYLGFVLTRLQLESGVARCCLRFAESSSTSICLYKQATNYALLLATGYCNILQISLLKDG